MGAGGVADVTKGDSEEFGTNEPRKDNLEDDEGNNNNPNDATTGRDAGTGRDSSVRPSAPKRQKTGDEHASGSQNKASSGASASASDAKSKSTQQHGTSGSTAAASSSDLDQIARHKAEKYVKLDEDDVALSSASTEQGKNEARADRRADALGESRSASSKEKEKHGGRADVDALHGDAGNGGSAGKGQNGGNGGNGGTTGSGSRKTDDEQSTSGKGEIHGGNDLEKVQRHQAEKFGAVNLQNE